MSRAHMMMAKDGEWVPWDGSGMTGGGGPTYGGPSGTQEVGAYKTTIGDGVSSVFVVAHNFGTRDVNVTMYSVNTGEGAETTVTRSSDNEVTIDFGGFVPPPDSVRVIVAGIV